MRAALLLLGVVAFAGVATGAYLLLATTSSTGSSLLSGCGHSSTSTADFEGVAPVLERALARGERVDVEVPPGRHKMMVNAEGGVLEALPRPPVVAGAWTYGGECPSEPSTLPLAATADLTMRVYVIRG